MHYIPDYFLRNIEACSRNHCCRVKAIRILYSKCVFVALVIQRAKPMHRIILPSVSRPALPYFPTLSHKRHDFRGGGLLNTKCVCWVFLNFVFLKHFSLSSEMSEIRSKLYFGLDKLVNPHEMCATAEMWVACWRVSRRELHVRSRDVSRVTEVWFRVIEFNVKSPLTSQLHA